MTIKDILSKLAKGEALTDEEKDFAAKYDEAAITNAAAAKARKAAEEKAAALQAKLDEADEKAREDAKKYDAFQKRFEKYEKEHAESKAREAAAARANTIHELAEKHGAVNSGSISQKAFKMLLEAHVGDADLADENAVKELFATFKSENKGVIAVPGMGSNTRGAPWLGASAPNGNPYSNRVVGGKRQWNLTEQIALENTNPQLAAALKAQAQAEPADGGTGK